MAGCSSTSGLSEGQQLYTGMKPTKYSNYEKNDHFSATKEELDVVLATTPNASLFGSPTWRSPFPIGLWIWNAFAHDSSAVGKWMVKAFGSKPVLMTTANPSLHASVGENLLRKRGYFDSNVSYEKLQQHNPKKAKLQYSVSMGHLWTIDSMKYIGFPTEADSLIKASEPVADIHNGDPFNVAQLEAERERLGLLFRDNGYYYYNTDDAQYLADTTTVPGKVLLRLQLADSLNSRSTHKWYIGKININLRKQMFETLANQRKGRRFTINYNGKKPQLRTSVISSNMRMRQGDVYSYEKQQQSQSRLNATGLFSSLNFNLIPRDSTDTCRTLDMTVDCVFDKPYDFYIEAYARGKTSNKYGPELIVGLTKRNAFRGGELFNVRLHGSYEWNAARSSSDTKAGINSYQYGAEASITLPRIFNPFRQPASKRRKRRQKEKQKAEAQGKVYTPRKRRRFYDTPSTIIKASTDVINRADFFKRHVVSGEYTYNWKSTANSEYTLSPLTLTYEYMQSRTDSFIHMEDRMPYLKTSMADQFIPKASFSYYYHSDETSMSPISWRTTISEASNILSLGYLAAGKKWGEKQKEMFQNPYAQFFKIETDFTKVWALSATDALAAHVGAGIIYSYGNSSVAPYTEQFFVGGASSIRAFNSREIGPGRYRSTNRMQQYVDQTGDLKFQANLEYRPKLFEKLYGAIFLDAGNVWTVRDDSNRPDSKFKFSHMFRDMALGTGVGLRFDIGFFLIRLDWGIGLHVPYSTSRSGFYNIPHFKDAQALHFAIGLPF